MNAKLISIEELKFRGARLLFVIKHIERISDYVTDICELTVYMTEAALIKHTNQGGAVLLE